MNGHVYAFSTKQGTKIGCTANPEARAKTLSMLGGHSKPQVWVSPPTKNYRKVEREAHSFFASKRTVGEWFDVCHEEVTSYLSSLGYKAASAVEIAEAQDKAASAGNALISAFERVRVSERIQQACPYLALVQMNEWFMDFAKGEEDTAFAIKASEGIAHAMGALSVIALTDDEMAKALDLVSDGFGQWATPEAIITLSRDYRALLECKGLLAPLASGMMSPVAAKAEMLRTASFYNPATAVDPDPKPMAVIFCSLLDLWFAGGDLAQAIYDNKVVDNCEEAVSLASTLNSPDDFLDQLKDFLFWAEREGAITRRPSLRVLVGKGESPCGSHHCKQRKESGSASG